MTEHFPVLSPAHYREFVEHGFGPLATLLPALDAEDPPRGAALRAELESLAAQYFLDNDLLQDYLLTRARKPAP
ncbi:MAG: hypothetical protein ACT4P1_06930 [Sporichthyaceae bacterium]